MGYTSHLVCMLTIVDACCRWNATPGYAPSPLVVFKWLKKCCEHWDGSLAWHRRGCAQWVAWTRPCWHEFCMSRTAALSSS